MLLLTIIIITDLSNNRLSNLSGHESKNKIRGTVRQISRSGKRNWKDVEIPNQSTSGGYSTGKQPEVHWCTHPSRVFAKNTQH